MRWPTTQRCSEPPARAPPPQPAGRRGPPLPCRAPNAQALQCAGRLLGHSMARLRWLHGPPLQQAVHPGVRRQQAGTPLPPPPRPPWLQSTVVDILAAMTPCARLYAFLGSRYAAAHPEYAAITEYHDWVTTYSSEGGCTCWWGPARHLPRPWTCQHVQRRAGGSRGAPLMPWQMNGKDFQRGAEYLKLPAMKEELFDRLAVAEGVTYGGCPRCRAGAAPAAGGRQGGRPVHCAVPKHCRADCCVLVGGHTPLIRQPVTDRSVDHTPSGGVMIGTCN